MFYSNLGGSTEPTPGSATGPGEIIRRVWIRAGLRVHFRVGVRVGFRVEQIYKRIIRAKSKQEKPNNSRFVC